MKRLAALFLVGLAACSQPNDLPNVQVPSDLNGTWFGSLTTGVGDSNLSLDLADTTQPGGGGVTGTATIDAAAGCSIMATVDGQRLAGVSYVLDLDPVSGPPFTLTLSGSLEPGNVFRGTWSLSAGSPGDACVAASSGMFSTTLDTSAPLHAPAVHLYRRGEGFEASTTITFPRR